MQFWALKTWRCRTRLIVKMMPYWKCTLPEITKSFHLLTAIFNVIIKMEISRKQLLKCSETPQYISWSNNHKLSTYFNCTLLWLLPVTHKYSYCFGHHPSPCFSLRLNVLGTGFHLQLQVKPTRLCDLLLKLVLIYAEQELALSIMPNWVLFTLRGRQKAVSKTLF
jgi:hypothetical protein